MQPVRIRRTFKEHPMAQKRTAAPKYLKTAEVAELLHVSPKTVTRWAKDGKLPHSRTLGGHRRFPGEAITKLAEELIESL
jgi:excisionase family DNA binding protein